MRYAIIFESIVTNVIVWDGECDWTPPAGSIAIAVDDGERASVGWGYGENQTPRFVEPPDEGMA